MYLRVYQLTKSDGCFIELVAADSKQAETCKLITSPSMYSHMHDYSYCSAENHMRRVLQTSVGATPPFHIFPLFPFFLLLSPSSQLLSRYKG